MRVVPVTPAERAAALSARIHRRFNHEGNTMDAADFDGIDYVEEAAFWRSFNGARLEWLSDLVPFAASFIRLGAELRAIALGNREGAR